MAKHEQVGSSDEYYTPKYIFDALGCQFDMDVAAPADLTFIHTPAYQFIKNDSLNKIWRGFVWMNPPFGGRNGILPWMEKIITHKNGIGLSPDRTSCPWWQLSAKQANGILFINGKVKFIKPDGSVGKQPSTGTTLFAYGNKAEEALLRAESKGLGIYMAKI